MTLTPGFETSHVDDGTDDSNDDEAGDDGDDDNLHRALLEPML